MQDMLQNEAQVETVNDTNVKTFIFCFQQRQTSSFISQ